MSFNNCAVLFHLADPGVCSDSDYSFVCEEFTVPVPPCFDPEAPLDGPPTNITVSFSQKHVMSESVHHPFSTPSGNFNTEPLISSGPSSFLYRDPEIPTAFVESTHGQPAAAQTIDNIADVLEGCPVIDLDLLRPERKMQKEASECKQAVITPWGGMHFTVMTQPQPTTELTTDNASEEKPVEVQENFESPQQPISTQPLPGSIETVVVDTQPAFSTAQENLQPPEQPISTQPRSASSESVLADTSEFQESLEAPQQPISTQPQSASSESGLAGTSEFQESSEAPQQPVSTQPGPGSSESVQAGTSEFQESSEAPQQPVSTQPGPGSSGSVQADTQAECSAPAAPQVNYMYEGAPITVYQTLKKQSSSEFAASVVSDALAIAVDAVATAGRAAMETVGNLIGGKSSSSQSDPVATYSGGDGCLITTNQGQNTSSGEPVGAIFQAS